MNLEINNITQTSIKYILGVFFHLSFLSVGYSQDIDSIKADILLDNTLLNQLNINAQFINSIEYTSDGFLLLASANQFYILGNGGIVPIFDSWENNTEIASFTVTANGILMAVSKNGLYTANNSSSFSKIVIPDSGMGVTSQYLDDIFVYDKILKNDKKVYSIYHISETEKIESLITISTPILSVFESQSQLIFSTKNHVFSVDIYTKQLFHLFSSPYDADIISIAGDTYNKTLYFSTENSIYRIKNNQIELLCKEFGVVGQNERLSGFTK